MLTWHFVNAKIFFIINLSHVDINLVLFIPAVYHINFLRFWCNGRDQNRKSFSGQGLKAVKIKFRN